MKTITRLAALVPMPLLLTVVALAIGASTANGAPGDLFEADYGSGNIYKFTPDGTQSTFASGLVGPRGLAFDSAGNLFAGGYLSGNIYKFTPDGTQSTFASGLSFPTGLAFDSADNLYVAAYSSGTINKFTPDGTQSTFATGLLAPQGLAFDRAGNLFVAVYTANTIYRFTPDGTQSTFATGTNGPMFLAIQPATCTPPPSGIVSWWPGDGNANDIVGGNNGTLQGNVTFAPGMVGQAFSFDGVDDYVRVASASNLNPTLRFTLDAWIFPTQDQMGSILEKWGDEGDYSNQRAYAFLLLPGGALGFAISDDAHQNDSDFHSFFSPANAVALSAWNHVAAVYDQDTGTRTIFVNGVQVAERSDAPITLTSSIADLAIGAHLRSSTNLSEFFNGRIDEAQIFNRALSESEIQAIYNAGSAGLCTQPCTPDTWTAKAAMLQSVLEACAAVVEEKLYIFDGPTQVYDPVADTWSFKTSDPVYRGLAAAGTINGKIYVAEGWANHDANAATTALRIYDPVTDSWTAGADSLVARGNSAHAIIGSKLYIASGRASFQQPLVDALEIYDSLTDCWSSGAPIPQAVEGARGAAFNGKFYVVGGTHQPGNTTLDAVQIYDPATNSWSIGSPMPTSRGGMMSGVVNGKLYVVDGGNNGGVVNNMEIYDPASDTWTTAASVPPPDLYVGGGIDSKLYAIDSSGTLEAYTASCATPTPTPTPTATPTPPPTIEVTVQTTPAGLAFSVDGINFNSTRTFCWVPGSSHTISTTSQQSGGTGVQYLWTRWSDNGAISHTVAPTTNKTYTAFFRTQYYLTMTHGTGGTVSPSSGWRNSGGTVSISATPASGYSFSNWAGSGPGSYSGTNNPASITMNGPITENASFTQNNVQVIIQTNPAGLSFSVDGTPYISTQTFSWTPGSSHTISTTSPQSGGTGVQYVWANWSDGGAISHTVAPATNRTYTARFGTQYYLTMNAGTGGTVSPTSGWRNPGATVSITARPAPGHGFRNWTGRGSGSYSGPNNPASITMGGPITETANFR